MFVGSTVPGNLQKSNTTIKKECKKKSVTYEARAHLEIVLEIVDTYFLGVHLRIIIIHNLPTAVKPRFVVSD